VRLLMARASSLQVRGASPRRADLLPHHHPLHATLSGPTLSPNGRLGRRCLLLLRLGAARASA
jgi:hypothetical protein